MVTCSVGPVDEAHLQSLDIFIDQLHRSRSADPILGRGGPEWPKMSATGCSEPAGTSGHDR
jgi:hypothetical protein